MSLSVSRYVMMSKPQQTAKILKHGGGKNSKIIYKKGEGKFTFAF